jgi:hypothetical protein
MSDKTPTDAPEVLARVHVSTPRRVFAMGTLLSLGGMLVWLGLETSGAVLAAKLGFLASGGITLMLAMRLWRATSVGLVLTDEGLADTEGVVLAPLGAIRRVDRGFFAFKPSNGFLLVLDHSLPRAWKPGLWWRMGRRLGVGGVCNGAETRTMADILAFKLAQAPDEGV